MAVDDVISKKTKNKSLLSERKAFSVDCQTLSFFLLVINLNFPLPKCYDPSCVRDRTRERKVLHDLHFAGRERKIPG